MDETPQDNSPKYIITDGKDGWVFQYIEAIPEEGAYVYQCPGCKKYIKVTPVELQESISTESSDIETVQQQQEQQTEQQQVPDTKEQQKHQTGQKKQKQSTKV
jgi:hypothetical protein